MTAQAIVKKSDLDRMAAVANERNVAVEMTDEYGRTFRITPAGSSQVEKSPLAPRGGVRL